MMSCRNDDLCTDKKIYIKRLLLYREETFCDNV